MVSRWPGETLFSKAAGSKAGALCAALMMAAPTGSASCLPTNLPPAQVVLIVNPAVKATTATKDDIRDVFTGSGSSLRDGTQVTPVLMKASATENDFLTAYVGKSAAAFRAGWRSLVFSGQANMPKQLDSDAAVVEYVARNPGAIGYIHEATPHEGVKVLVIR